MSNERKTSSWWQTLPGILTAVAGLITAVTGLLLAFGSLGFLKAGNDATGPARIEASGTLPPVTGTSQQRATGSATTAQLTTESVGSRGAGNPAAITVGTTYRLTLENEEESYFQLAVPDEELKIVVDMRLRSRENGYLGANISLLDVEGVVREANLVHVNAADVGSREVTNLALKPGSTAVLRVKNRSALADLWLTIVPAAQRALLPFFGEISPAPITLDTPVTGGLETNQYAYYGAIFPPGEYRALLDFAAADRREGHLGGELTMFDGDGGNARKVIFLNGIGTSYRDIQPFAVTREQTVILRVLNTSRAAGYTLRITAQ